MWTKRATLLVRVMCTSVYELHVQIHDKWMTVSENTMSVLVKLVCMWTRVYTCEHRCAWCKWYMNIHATSVCECMYDVRTITVRTITVSNGRSKYRDRDSNRTSIHENKVLYTCIHVVKLYVEWMIPWTTWSGSLVGLIHTVWNKEEEKDCELHV